MPHRRTADGVGAHPDGDHVLRRDEGVLRPRLECSGRLELPDGQDLVGVVPSALALNSTGHRPTSLSSTMCSWIGCVSGLWLRIAQASVEPSCGVSVASSRNSASPCGHREAAIPGRASPAGTVRSRAVSRLTRRRDQVVGLGDERRHRRAVLRRKRQIDLELHQLRHVGATAAVGERHGRIVGQYPLLPGAAGEVDDDLVPLSRSDQQIADCGRLEQVARVTLDHRHLRRCRLLARHLRKAEVEEARVRAVDECERVPPGFDLLVWRDSAVDDRKVAEELRIYVRIAQ